jgi:ketosteroid isomerase-like protein
MHPNRAMIERFYSCFRLLDGDGMAQCYHENIEFSDPVFPKLQGSKVGAMWKMLCSQAQGFELRFNDTRADDTRGSAHWEAKCIFSMTDRKVRNKIDASFRFQDGKIIQHHDSFNFWKWSFMALGPVGLLLGWSPVVKNKVQRQAAKNLERFIKNLEE